jgi:hypothetical protein
VFGKCQTLYSGTADDFHSVHGPILEQGSRPAPGVAAVQLVRACQLDVGSENGWEEGTSPWRPLLWTGPRIVGVSLHGFQAKGGRSQNNPQRMTRAFQAKRKLIESPKATAWLLAGLKLWSEGPPRFSAPGQPGCRTACRVPSSGPPGPGYRGLAAVLCPGSESPRSPNRNARGMRKS